MNPMCDCKQANHEHGTYTMYVVHQCRCDHCREATSEHARQRRKNQLYGRYHLTDAEPARRHVRALMSAGMGWKRVAKAAGITSSTLYPLLYGRGGNDPRPPRKQISKALEAKLLAVTPDLAAGSCVDNLGSVRRLQALAAIGWSQHRLAQIFGMFPGNFGKVIHGERGSIRLSTAKQIEVFFDENWDAPPVAETRFEQAGITRAKREAAAKGWVTAAAWDDIDDPTEEPKANIVSEITGSRVASTLEKLDRLELLARDGYGDNEDTYVRAGWSSRASAWRALQRAGELEHVDRLKRNDQARQIAS